MSPSADAPSSSSLSEVLNFTTGQIVQEIGYDDDVDLDLRDAIEDFIGGELEDEDTQEIVDAVVLWWREGDGDLTDAMVDTLRNIDAGAPVWVMTPKAGRDGHVMPGDIQESAGIAGLRVMSSVSVARDWTGTRLASRTN
ncbi:hypothetical protein FM106_29990 [Brachybacterium faecium]|uniref:DUF3052 domain-containing protein n=1 Tax=Brachybacterium faecium (strain ATCC 43885 / DSM 4810 / JCM 11609 / LMG 19847 / NBRC 14762 / NCIMB 9860 / 6-10) TaxID=446465 RepID=C7MD39_BRAFD|nr:DUF3052 domain-containing protein [Brachybacterium faecium]ACU85496.1 hypothetical protein Bfae_16720 [Brachybacterium faecium DSM 4810]SLN05157.1 hypothetical protein FM106_29990 [Brachybacterium faecium]HJG52167.1 DUF3052 domain-containing protein [Brachybacterium faecium]